MDTLNQFFKKCLHYLWLGLAGLIIFFAILLTIIESLLPSIGSMKSEIEQKLSLALGTPVLLGSIDAEWKTTGPVFNVKELIINAPSNRSHFFSVRAAEVEFNFWQSLLAMQVVTKEITIEGVVVNLALDENGNLVGLSRQKPNEETPADSTLENIDPLIDALLKQKNFAIKNSRIIFNDIREGEDHVEIIEVSNIAFNNSQSFHQVIADMRLSSTGKLGLIVESAGDPRKQDTAIDVYAHSENWNLVEIPYLSRFLEKHMGSALLNAEFWLERKAGKWSNASSRIHLDNVVFKQKAWAQNPLKSVDLRFELIGEGQTFWQFVTHDITIESAQGKWQGMRLSGAVDFHDFTQEPRWMVRLENLEINKASQLLLSFQEPSTNLANYLVHAKPTGSIHEVILSQDVGRPVVAEVELTDFGVEAYEDYPGLDNIDLAIRWDKNTHLAFFLEIDDTALDSAAFSEAVPLKHMSVQGKLENFENIQRIYLDKITLQTSDFVIQGASRVDLANEGIMLSAGLTLPKLKTARLSQYLPQNVMKEKLYAFLTQAFKAGDLNETRLVVRGNLESFPYENPEGIFSAIGQTKNVTLKFLKEWPAFEALNAELLFEGDGMKIDVASTVTEQVLIKGVQGQIPVFSTPNPKLHVVGQVKDEAQKIVNYINQTPLKRKIGKVFEEHHIRKPIEVDIDLSASLGKVPEGEKGTTVQGVVDFDDNFITFVPLKHPSEQLNGRIHFTESSVKSENLRAISYGETVTALIDGRAVNDKMRIDININSTITAKNLREHIDVAILRLIEGKILYDVNIQVLDKGGDTPSEVIADIHSKLEDVNILLPASLSRPIETEKPIRVRLLPKEESMKVSFDWNENIWGRVDLPKIDGQYTFYGASIALGQPDSKWHHVSINKGITVEGNFENVALKEWIDYYSAIKPRFPELTTKQERSSEEDKPITVAIKAQAVDIQGMSFHNVRTIIDTPEPNNWRMNVSGDEVKGEVIYRPDDKSGQVIGEIDYLSIGKMENESKDRFDIDSELIPSILVQCQKCQFQNIDLGRVEFVGLPMNLGYEVEASANLNSLFKLNLNGLWLQENTFDLTKIKGTFQSDNIGNLFQHWKIESGLKDSDTMIQFNLNWPDNPFEPSIGKLAGTLSAEMNKGAIEQVSDKPARIFSLLSLTSLRRRLSLDFSDLFGDGFFFDKLNASFTLGDGWARVDKAIVQGAAADVEIMGSSDLINKEYDQLILVSPKLSSSLPILAGWAIDPSLILLVFVVNQIIDPAVKVLTQLEYQIVGKWDAPEVIEVGKYVEEIPVKQLQNELNEEDVRTFELLDNATQPKP